MRARFNYSCNLYGQKECHARSAEKDLLSLIFGTRVKNLRLVATLAGFLRVQTDTLLFIRKFFAQPTQNLQ